MGIADVKSVLAGLLVLAALSLWGGAGLHADSGLLDLPRARGEQCVQPTDVMRRRHMDFLEHQRDDTVHLGIRTKKHSLVGCVDCHVQQSGNGEYIPVNAPGQFCSECHQFTATKLDCFECHATVPHESGDQAALNPEAPSLLARRIGRFLGSELPQ